MTDKIVSPELERHMGHVGDKPERASARGDDGPDLSNQINEVLERAVASVKAQGQTILDRARDEPATWLLIATGVGFALGLVASRAGRS